MHLCALLRNELSPVSPVILRLSPVQSGTEKVNGDKDLGSLFVLVPGVPGDLGAHSEGGQMSEGR